MTDLDYGAASQLSPGNTTALLVAVNLFLLVAFANAVLWARRYGRRARDAAASVSEKEPRSAGRAVLCGTVETEDPNRAAVVVTVQERGEQRQVKGRWSHSWTEFDRDVQVEPFYLVLASGTRVRVEPDPDVFLVDKLELTHRGNPRTRQARLEQGETAYVEGVLASRWHPRASASELTERSDGLYRGALPTGFVMTNGVDRMLISTEPLPLRHQRRASAHRLMAILLGGALLVTNVFLFGSAHLLNAFGEVVQTRVRATRTWVTVDKGRSTTHYGVRASYVDPTSGVETEVDDEVSGATFLAAQSGEPVPFRVVLRWPSHANVGTGTTVGPVQLILSLMLVAFLMGANVIHVRRSRAWYDRDIIEEHGSGPLQF